MVTQGLWEQQKCGKPTYTELDMFFTWCLEKNGVFPKIWLHGQMFKWCSFLMTGHLTSSLTMISLKVI